MGKNPPADAGDMDSIPGSVRSPRGGNGSSQMEETGLRQERTRQGAKHSGGVAGWRHTGVTSPGFLGPLAKPGPPPCGFLGRRKAAHFSASFHSFSGPSPASVVPEWRGKLNSCSTTIP